RSHEILTRLAILLDAKRLLHRLHVREALAPELVTARIQIRPMPRLGRHIIHPTITARIALQPGLDRAGVDIDSHAIAVIRVSGRRGKGATGLLRPRRTAIRAIRRLRPATRNAGIVP